MATFDRLCAEAASLIQQGFLYNIRDPASRADILRVDHRADVYRSG